MISDRLAEEMDKQIKEEFESASYYLAMASYLEAENWEGFSKFMKAQAVEEMEHGMKFYNFLHEVGHRAEVPALDQPKLEYSSLEEVFQTALDHEKHISGRIDKLVQVSEEEGDSRARSLLQWFVDEQVEEENTMEDILVKIKRIGDSSALYMLDKELGQRQLGAERE